MSTSNSFLPVSPATLAAFRAAGPAIIRETVARSLARNEEVAHHGEQAERVIAAGLGFTTRMLDAVMAVGEIALLEDELLWARDRLPHDGVAPEHVLSRLKIYREVTIEMLPREQAAEVEPYLDWMIARQSEVIERGGP